MRGALIVISIPIKDHGIIPAYAGSTGAPPWSAAARWDHPRVCGEHARRPVDEVGEAGSSPRMRGAHLIDRRTCRNLGIIPAYAGSTSTGLRRAQAVRDHPRVCGEHDTISDGDTLMQGSSPRMRGAPLQSTRRLPHNGIIPAYAGSTVRWRRRGS